MSERDAFDVLGIGNAIVDVLTHAGEEFLAGHDLQRGTMTLVDAERAEELYEAMGPGIECSGGSAANTLAGLASLGGRAAYIGKVCDDQLGEVFRHDIRAAGVAFETPSAESGPPTARCLVFVGPDGQRTMQTFLGASATLGPEEIDPDLVRRAAITYLEGYLFDPEPAKRAFWAAAEIARNAGRKVALTLSDPFCVARHRADFQRLVEAHVDILFANEQEAVSLYETNDLESALRRLAGHCAIAVVTRSELGSVVLSADRRVEVPAVPVARVVDTTGAGDLYAAGFLFGLGRGRDLATCARLGSVAAAEIISHLGARPEADLSELAGAVLAG